MIVTAVVKARILAMGRSIHIVLFVPKEKKSSSLFYCFDDDVLRNSKNFVDMLLVPALIHIDCKCFI